MGNPDTLVLQESVGLLLLSLHSVSDDKTAFALVDVVVVVVVVNNCASVVSERLSLFSTGNVGSLKTVGVVAGKFDIGVATPVTLVLTESVEFEPMLFSLTTACEIKSAPGGVDSV